MKVLLINPPGDQMYIRDYFSAAASKAGYYYHPVDLLVLSGKLRAVAEVSVIDAIVERMSEMFCLERINAIDPDVIIALVGSDTFEADLGFLVRARTRPAGAGDRKLVVMGDIMLHHSKELIASSPLLDAVLFDFTNDDILHYLSGDLDKVDWMTIKEEAGWRIVHRASPRTFRFDVPQHELFPLNKYRLPHGKERLFASVLTTFGCYFNCTFCSSTFSTLGYRLREIPNLIEELRHIRSLGIREVYFRDYLITGNRPHLRELCRAMIDARLGIEWIAASRVDTVDEEMLELMREAGCHTIQFGVESGNQRILDHINKKISVERIREIFAKCEALGIRTLAHLILGLPGETRETIMDTINLARELPCDVASFNLAMPLFGTKMRDEVIRDGLLTGDGEHMDTSISGPMIKIEGLTGDQLMALRRRAILSFYLRPSYILRRLRRLRSIYELRNLVLDGFSLLTREV